MTGADLMMRVWLAQIGSGVLIPDSAQFGQQNRFGTFPGQKRVQVFAGGFLKGVPAGDAGAEESLFKRVAQIAEERDAGVPGVAVGGLTLVLQVGAALTGSRAQPGRGADRGGFGTAG